MLETMIRPYRMAGKVVSRDDAQALRGGWECVDKHDSSVSEVKAEGAVAIASTTEVAADGSDVKKLKEPPGKKAGHAMRARQDDHRLHHMPLPQAIRFSGEELQQAHSSGAHVFRAGASFSTSSGQEARGRPKAG